MSAGRANLWPRMSAPVDYKTGKISTNYRRFFSRFKKRVGPPIAPVLDVSPNADIARAVNEVLAEIRAQGWLDPEWSDPGNLLSKQIRAVTMIPAATEFGYATTPIYHAVSEDFPNLTVNTVAHTFDDEGTWEEGTFPQDKTDLLYALDNLEESAPNCRAVSLFVSWFGTDLRAGECLVQPRPARQSAENNGFLEYWYPKPWTVCGLTRDDLPAISSLGSGDPAFDGTPADFSVVEAIREMRQTRGLTVSFTPFLLMDIPAGNALPDPYNPAGSQSAYPWRGRITCHPAPGVSATPDKTAAAAAQIAAFVGAAQPSDFFVAGDDVLYSGTAEWSYRRMILHYAHLCALAGGVDIFVIGTELRGLTWVRESVDSHPFVTALAALAADVKSILPDAQITYAADWSEYHSYQPQDGSGDLIFHLDPLWADANIDAIGMDCYFPLSDWRDGVTHLDYLAGHTSVYDYSYLAANIFGGEGYDYFYASDADRNTQTRTPITDGAYGKPWVFRYKDMPNWWGEPHYNRIGGVEAPTSTAWVPRSKPFWFTELGCPSVNKGANQPNVFVDLVTDSAESAYPYYSSEATDVTMQRRYNQAWLRYVDETAEDFIDAHNPASDVYNGRMLSVDRIYLYTWDARPYPALPAKLTFWIDGLNWPTGHWLDGKLPVQLPPTQANDGQALLEATAPTDPFFLDPQTGRLRPKWAEYLDRIGFVRGSAISTLQADASTPEIVEAVNAIIAVLRSQKRIA
jgi:hypothetical protein